MRICSKMMKPWVCRGTTVIRNVIAASGAVGPGSWGFEGLEVLMLREYGGEITPCSPVSLQ